MPPITQDTILTISAVPQGTKANEVRALIRKQRASILGDDVAGKVNAATTSAGNQFAKATDSAAMMYEDAFNKATSTWSHSRLKSFLDARGIVRTPEVNPHHLQ